MYPEQVLYQQYNAEVMEKDGKASSNMTTAVTTLRPLTKIQQDQDFTQRRLVSTLFFSLLQFFLTGPAQKSSKYGTGPTQKWKHD